MRAMLSDCCGAIPINNTLRVDTGICIDGSCGDNTGLCSKCNDWTSFSLDFFNKEEKSRRAI